MIGQSFGSYVVKEKIGQGGMGAVYLAEHKTLSRRVAVKVLLPHIAASKELAARFFNEAKAAAQINNPHIVDVIDFGELPDGSAFIVMEWLDGQSLQQLLSREKKLPLDRVAHIARGMARALAAAHAHGIVHRDLKPDNIFLVRFDDDADYVKVLDFGIAKLTLGDGGDVRTQTGAILGTPQYMSPEQCNGGAVDRRTDVYAMGVILYQMLTGRLPFVAGKLTELLIAHATQAPPPLRTLDAGIPPAVESAVLMALEKDPERRFNSVEALAHAFVDEARSTPLPVTPAPVIPTMAPSGGRGKMPQLAILGAGALVVVAALVFGMRGRSAPASSTSPATPAAAVASDKSGRSDKKPEDKPLAVWGGRWGLLHTDCPAGSLPGIVESVQTGATVRNHAAGFPDTSGTVEPDGHFRVHNVFGTCSGRVVDRTVSETCTNKLHMSCHATYQRID
jgi:eukaryotic-like serine/threonine-protein kinase